MKEQSEKLLSPSTVGAVYDPAFGSHNQAVELIETKFQEAVDKHIEMIRHSIQHVLEQQITDLFAQLEHIETRWCQEREALSTFVKGDMRAIETMCNDLKALHVQHQLSLKDLSVQLKTSLQESEQRQAEHVNTTGKQFAETVSVQQRKLADLETAIETSTTSIGISETSMAARLNELKKTLEDTVARTEHRISSIGLQSEAASTAARVGDLSKEVSTCLENTQQFQHELKSRTASLQGNMHCLDARVGGIEGRVELQTLRVVHLEKSTHSLQNETMICAQGVKDLAVKHQEQCQSLSQLSSRLNAVISELASWILAQKEEISSVAEAVSHLDTDSTHDGQQKKLRPCGSLSHLMATPEFGRRPFSDAGSSIALQSSEGRQSTWLEFISNRRRTLESPNFTPSPIHNNGALEFRISELEWHGEDGDPGAYSEDGFLLEYTYHTGEDTDCRGRHLEADDAEEAKSGDEEDVDDPDMIQKPCVVSNEDNKRIRSVESVERLLASKRGGDIPESASQEHGSSSQPITSVFASPAAPNWSVHINDMEIYVDLLRRTMCSKNLT